MGAGGDGTVKKSKKSKASGAATSKKLKGLKAQKGKRKDKGAKTRSRSKTKKSSPSSRTTSFTSGDEPIIDDEPHNKEAGHETGTACMIKPEKMHQTCTTLWSEPTTCCADLLNKATVTPPPCGDAKCRNVCLRLVREEVDNEMEDRQAQARLCIERLSNERDYYRAEFERLYRFFEKVGASNEDEEGNALSCIACRKKDQMIEYLQRENEVLAKEKFCLMSRLEEGGTRFDTESPGGKCCKTSCKRTERERDLLRLDIQRLEEESDCLREKIKIVSENKARDYVKFQEQRTEYENVINKLEAERRELIKGQGIRRVNINTLEEKVDTYSNLLRVAQEEIHRIKMQYCQLKKLHEQCDKALLDTQAQLMEVETELVNCRNKKDPAKNRRYSRNKQISAQNCPCADIERDSTEDIKRTIRQLDNDKDNLLNQLDIKTELLCQCQEDVKNKCKIISKLEEEMRNLKETLSVMEGEVIELKEKCHNSATIIKEKDTEIKNLQTDNEQKLMDVKKCQTILEEKEEQNKILQAEVEQLNKETHALATSNHQLQTDTHQSRVQVSVAMETVNELENKIKALEEEIEEYERKIRLMKNELEEGQLKMSSKEMEINNLVKNKNNLQNLSEQLDMENKAREKTICDLKCECQKLRINLSSLDSKERMISDLSSEMDELKAERDALERENSNLSRRVNKLENKLFQCICTICDSAQEKCTMANCIFKDYTNITSQHETLFSETREIGIQTFRETSIKNIRTSSNSVKQVMAAVPLTDEQSSKAITSLTTLPGSLDKGSLCKKDTIISSMYQSVDPTAPFTYKHLNEAENKNKKKSPLNVIAEEKSTGFFNDKDEKIDKIYDPKKPSWSIRSDVEERQKYIIDNVTSVCKVIQVDTEDILQRRTRLDGADISKSSSRSSSDSHKNF